MNENLNIPDLPLTEDIDSLIAFAINMEMISSHEKVGDLYNVTFLTSDEAGRRILRGVTERELMFFLNGLSMGWVVEFPESD